MAIEIIYGRNTVQASLLSGEVVKLYLSKTAKVDDLYEMATAAKVPIDLVETKVLDVLSDHATHQGVVAEVKPFEYLDLDALISKAKKKKYPLIIMAAGLNDPHNLGAIIRTADAFSVDGIVLAKHRQVLVTPTVKKIATGAHNYVSITQVTNLNQTAKLLKEAGFWLVGSDGEADKNYLSLQYNFPCVLVIGSEGRGIPPLLKKNCDYMIKIPQTGHVNSLNASVATGILVAGIRSKQL